MRSWRAQDPVAKLVTFVLNLLSGAGMGEPGLQGWGRRGEPGLQGEEG